MVIKVDAHLQLDKITKHDKVSLIKYINHPAISQNTLTIPYPYTESDAEWWIFFVDLREREVGRLTNWAIRYDGELIGGLGLLLKYPKEERKDEFGYWLGAPFWNKGIMTSVVQAFSQHCFEELGYKRLEAPIFHFNAASGRVLEKAGFKFEKDIKRHYKKEGKYVDAKMYARNSEADQGIPKKSYLRL